ncbi:hypothetical protein Drorol1_Dr00017927 [Drosera rotundifolia]
MIKLTMVTLEHQRRWDSCMMSGFLPLSALKEIHVLGFESVSLKLWWMLDDLPEVVFGLTLLGVFWLLAFEKIPKNVWFGVFPKHQNAENAILKKIQNNISSFWAFLRRNPKHGKCNSSNCSRSSPHPFHPNFLTLITPFLSAPSPPDFFLGFFVEGFSHCVVSSHQRWLVVVAAAATFEYEFEHDKIYEHIYASQWFEGVGSRLEVEDLELLFGE